MKEINKDTFKVEQKDTFYHEAIKHKNIQNNNTAKNNIKLHDEIIQANIKTDEYKNLKKNFLQNISHEIRTPMNAILGFSSLLKNRDISDEKRMLYIGIIEKNGNKMIEIINDLIDLSEIQTGSIQTYPRHADLNQMLYQLYSCFKSEALEKKIEFNYIPGFPDESCVIITDEHKLYQILFKLLNNALKFTENGKITFGYYLIGRSLEFYVHDTGIGIAEDKKELIFESFVQGDDSISRTFEGLGIGLAIVKSYVHLLGGSIWVDSEVGKGSTFSFTIPLK